MTFFLHLLGLALAASNTLLIPDPPRPVSFLLDFRYIRVCGRIAR